MDRHLITVAIALATESYVGSGLPNKCAMPSHHHHHAHALASHEYACRHSTLCGVMSCLHRGHSGLSASHSCKQAQQKTCPHVVAAGARLGERHSEHVRADTSRCDAAPAVASVESSLEVPSSDLRSTMRNARARRSAVMARNARRSSMSAPSGAYAVSWVVNAEWRTGRSPVSRAERCKKRPRSKKSAKWSSAPSLMAVPRCGPAHCKSFHSSEPSQRRAAASSREHNRSQK
mmetsp:Transcript_45416/g.119286  ORF Transcript_45416/g.119286 Transcript_45416/m.119286 type:complete len:233 (-) Transcript_45416:349-1047(-)